MTETTLVQEQKKVILNHLPDVSTGVVVTKHHDRATRDLPDLSIIYGGPTFYVESKFLKRGQRLNPKTLRPGQVVQCVKTDRASGGRCWIVVYAIDHVGRKTTTIWKPWAVAPLILPHEGLRILGIGFKAQQPVEVSHRDLVYSMLAEHGAIVGQGFDHLLIARIIETEGLSER